MNWIVLFTNMVLIQVQAQNVSLLFIEKSIQIKNDTLYFNVRVQNNSADILVFYNLNYVGNGNVNLTDSKLKKAMPSLLVDIFDENNELPSIIRARTGPKDFSKYLSVIGKNHIIKPSESVVYNIALDLWPINLKKGTYKMQLRYFSNCYFNKSFKKSIKTDPGLNHSILFKGILRSNICLVSVE